MPDYTYHPFFKHLLFRMNAEDSRRLTLGLLEFQSRSALGRRVFRLFGHGLPPKELSVTVFGMNFPGPIGLAPGIDIDASALTVMQYLGFGFMTVGPAGAAVIPRNYALDPLRVPERHALLRSARGFAPSAEQIAARIESAKSLSVPVGVALQGGALETAVANAREIPSFFTLPPACIEETVTLKRIRAATKRPLLLRLDPDWTDAQVDARTDTAIIAGLNGCVATAGIRSPLLPGGEMDGPFLHARVLKIIERVARRHGDAFPILGSGGILSPGDALAALDAGAKLIEVYAGFVYTGPGLPGRIVHALEHRLRHPNPCTTAAKISPAETNGVCPLDSAPAARTQRRGGFGWMLTAITGMILFASGLFALILAATVKLLPYDVAYLGMTMSDLCARNQCRIVHFMQHDRVSFGGSIMSIGAIYLWLSASPLRRGEAWAWWTLFLSGLVGFASFLTYLGYGYLDIWHGRATLALLPVFVLGMILSYQRLKPGKGPSSLLRPGARAWLYSSAGMGRLLMVFVGIGMIIAGATIMTVGMTTVFVPQDLEYMQVTVAQINAINPRLVPLIAHDRAGFGGGLCSGGLAILFSAWCGARPGASGLWWTFFIAGLIGFATAIGIHPIVGYTSFTHLLPAYIGSLAFLAGICFLWKPLCRTDATDVEFSEI